MIYFENCYASVWKVEKKEKYAEIRISTSSKNTDGAYTYSSWTARCFSKIMDKAAALKEHDHIKIIKGAVKNELYTTKEGEKRPYLCITIFDFEMADAKNDGGNKSATKSSSATSTKAKSVPAKAEEHLDEDELPWA